MGLVYWIAASIIKEVSGESISPLDLCLLLGLASVVLLAIAAQSL